ncbi:peroxiredoxin family protein [Mucilaginibacter flavus]|uniref:peroxiredoxin family protein n=1 Tax=Mucilaginibacter flavus TaxID=931504 RepID=UPI0025B508B6|nr:TlpA disulfide reductase family protein [Mucilaginibacter flavus]MDN3581518.1 TlpA disulfide reductase family protein [Mucilaginibacter flavus]
MRNIYALLLLLAIALSAKAQDTTKRVMRRSYTIDETSMVKDSTGKVLSFAEWTALTRTREYLVVPEDFGQLNNKYVLLKKGGDAINHRLHRPAGNIPANKPVNNDPGSAIPPQPPAGDPYDKMKNWPKPIESEYFKTGQQIRSFSTHDINGNKLSLKELRGKIVVLNFWFIGCPACMDEIPALNEVSAKYKNNPNVVFIAVALDTKSYIKKFLAETPFNYQIIDDGGFYAKTYGIGLYPTNLILDKEGKVAMHWVGDAPSAPYWMTKTIDENLK